MKVLALYLPQFHEIDENNKWWGQGYTEWTAVKNAVRYSKKQIQPRVPRGENYYDLKDCSAKALKWQAKLAKDYNVYGFVYYHYWFETGKQLLEKPMEILLTHKEIDIPFCVCWANESWRRGWYSTNPELLMEQKYGDIKDYVNHFNYLLPFFQDKRYIKVEGKPMVCIYHSAEIEDLSEMMNEWKKLAKANGLPGIFFVSGNTGAKLDSRTSLFDAYYNFEPSYSLSHKYSIINRALYGATVLWRSTWNRISKHKIIERPINGSKFIKIMARKDIVVGKKTYPCVFPQWDNTPRRKESGTVFYNMTTNNFRKQIEMAKRKYKDSEFIFVNAWNEWGEGAYLEPDESAGNAYLEVIRDEFSN